MPVRKLKAAVRKMVKKSGSQARSKPAAASTKKSAKSRKRAGDILGISAARVPEGTPRATADRGGRPKGVELPRLAKRPALLRPARVRG